MSNLLDFELAESTGDPKRDRLRAAFVTHLVAMTMGVSAREIAGPTRNSAKAAQGRQLAMYLSHVYFNWPLMRVGAAFDRDRSTAAYACQRVEDLRDDPAFDDALSALEACMRAVPGRLAA